MKGSIVLSGSVAAIAAGVWFGTHARVGATNETAAEAAAMQQPVQPADLVLRNGRIVTVDDEKPEAQALAVRGDTIVAVGSNQEIQPYVGAATKVIDLKGALATPGFIDAHVHFTGVGDAAKNLKLAIAKSWDEIVRMVGDAAKKAKPGNGFSGGAGIRKNIPATKILYTIVGGKVQYESGAVSSTSAGRP